MSQADSSDSTAPPGGDNPFPAIAETIVGAGLVKTTDARELHRFLKVGRDFTTWIKSRIGRYGFVENVDYVKEEVFPRSGENLGGRPKDVYHLTLDTAKEIAMVENNAQGRAARRYFIECERRAKEGGIDAKVVGGVAKGVIAKAIGDLMPALIRDGVLSILDKKRAAPTLDFADSVSAYQMIEMAGVAKVDRQRGTAQMVTNRMLAFCARHQVACLRTPAYVNPAEPYRFPHGLACLWLLGEDRGLELIRAQVDRAKARKTRRGRGSSGQAALALV